MSIPLKINQTKRFEDAYGSTSLELRHLIIGAIHDFVWRYCSDPRTVLLLYDTISGLSAPVRKADVSGSDRLLFYYENGSLLLLDVGPHEVTERYTIKKWKTDRGQRLPGLPQFYPERAGFFRDAVSNDSPFYFEDEPNPEWIYYLDERQSQVEKKIRNKTFKAVDSGNTMRPVFIVGGPDLSPKKLYQAECDYLT